MKKLMLMVVSIAISVFTIFNLVGCGEKVKPLTVVIIAPEGQVIDGGINENVYNAFENKKYYTRDVREIPDETDFITLFKSVYEDESPELICLTNGKSASDVITYIKAKEIEHRSAENSESELPKVLIVGYDAGNLPSSVALFNFDNEQSAFLGGYLSAAKSQSGKIAFVGGAQTGTRENAQRAFDVGARYYAYKKQISSPLTVLSEFTADNKIHVQAKARDFANQGADVLFAAAGNFNLGVLEQADTSGVLYVGSEIEINDPDLSSANLGSAKNDAAAFIGEMMKEFVKNRNNLSVFGKRHIGTLENNGVVMAYDKELVSKALREEIDSIIKDIINGKIDYQYGEY